MPRRTRVHGLPAHAALIPGMQRPFSTHSASTTRWENTKPGAPATGRGTRQVAMRLFGTTHLSGAGRFSQLGALCTATPRGRDGFNGFNPGAGWPIWSLRLPAGACITGVTGLAGQSWSGDAHLAPRGIEGSAQAAQTRLAVAERWLLYPSSSGTAQPRLVLGLRI